LVPSCSGFSLPSGDSGGCGVVGVSANDDSRLFEPCRLLEDSLGDNDGPWLLAMFREKGP
jgi:hypothetical protein